VNQIVDYNCAGCNGGNGGNNGGGNGVNNGGNNGGNGGNTGGDIRGFYSWSWLPTVSLGPASANHAVAFTGWATVGASLGEWNSQGHSFNNNGMVTWLSVGGGNHNGVLNSQNVRSTGNQCGQVKSAGFSGILFDVEKVSEGASVMIPAFDEAFHKCKQAGLLVGVTTSHSAPYDTPTPSDAVELVRSWCASGGDLDLISPQLYSSGHEQAPEFATTYTCTAAGCNWDLYQNCGADFVPSIVDDSHYAAVKAWATNTVGVPASGFFQWKHI